jgi:hypothetical protein
MKAIKNKELKNDLCLSVENKKPFTMIDNKIIEMLIVDKKYREAFVLFVVIKYRAMWTDFALIGDYTNYGLNEYGYRKAKQILNDLGLCSFRSNRYGTVAKILRG